MLKLKKNKLRSESEQKRLRNLRKHKTPWNKGRRINLDKYPNWGMSGKVHSTESKKKMIEAKLGNKNPMWGKHRDLHGSKNPMYAKRHSETTRRKIGNRKYLKGKEHVWYGRHHSEEVKRKNSMGRKQQFQNGFIHPRGMLGRHHGVETKEAISFASRLSNNSNWQGGLSFEPYDSRFNDQLKKRIRKRDNYMCQLCGLTESELCYTLQIHHVDYNKKNNVDTNLISLCLHCHTKTNHKRKIWEKKLQHLIGEKICVND